MILRKLSVAFLAGVFIIFPYFPCSAHNDGVSAAPNTAIGIAGHAVNGDLGCDIEFDGYAREFTPKQEEFGEDAGDDETQYEEVEGDDSEDENVESGEEGEEYNEDEGSDDEAGGSDDEEYVEDEDFDDYEVEEGSIFAF